METLKNQISTNYASWTGKLCYRGFSEQQAQDFVTFATECIVEHIGSGVRDADQLLRHIDILELAERSSLPMDMARIGLITIIPLILSHFGNTFSGNPVEHNRVSFK